MEGRTNTRADKNGEVEVPGLHCNAYYNVVCLVCRGFVTTELVSLY